MKRVIALVLAGVLALGACESSDGGDDPIVGSPSPRTGDPGRPPVKIGLVGTMTGPEGWRGEDAFEGADLGVHILNRGRGEEERRYELEVLDDGGDGVRSLELLRSLLARGETVGVVYAGPPEALVDAQDVLRRARVPAILLYGDLYGARQLSSHLFQASPPYAWQARDLARYLTRDRRYRDVGVLTQANDPSAAIAARKADESLREYGIEEPVVTTFQADVRVALERLRDSQVEAIVVQGDPSALERIYEELGSMQARYRGTGGARVLSASRRIRRKRQRTGWWKPQLVGFELMVNDRVKPPPSGTIATASYARGSHLLPIPSFRRFRSGFRDWWDSNAYGFEIRAYDSTLALGRAAESAGEEGDPAEALEQFRSERFGGLPITLGPDDHVLVEEVTIGLWTVPYPEDEIRERERLPGALPWVLLARGFSIDGETTDILTADWRWLFRRPPPRGGPAPRFTRMRFGVTTGRSDPLR
jgi:ABC-type branched-subunit amino acid transport system substrate-binding protein